jgi:hypothetical protein
MKWTKPAALLTVCALASSASAVVSIVPSFAPVGPGVTLNPNVGGTGILNFDTSTFETTVAIVVFGLQRNEDYGVRVDSDGSGSAIAQAFTARTFLGLGAYATVIPGDATHASVIDIFKWDGDPDPFNIWEISASEERARGFGNRL